MIRTYLPIFTFVLLIVAIAYFALQWPREKKAFVLNQTIFNEFKGKKDLEQKLNVLKTRHRQTLDSIGSLVEKNPKDAALRDLWRSSAEQFQYEQEEQSQRYTADIWKRINQYVADYGKANGYTFIYGASGDGNLMYADERADITKEVIEYVNRRYAEGE